MTDLSHLVLRLEAESARLTSELDKATRRLQGFQRSTQSITSSVRTALGTLGLGFSTVALVRSLGTTIDFADNMGKLAQKTGVAVEELSALNYAAQLSDVSTDSLATAFKKLAVNQSDAIKGTGEAKDAFAAIGVSLTDLKSKSPDQLLKQIADRFAGYEDGANKAALAVKLFGRAGTDLIPLLNQGSAGIASAETEARRLGITIDGQTAAAAERFNDQMKALGSTFTGFKIGVASDILPGLTAITQAFTEAMAKGEGFKGLMESLNAVGAGGPFGDPKQVQSLDALRAQLDTLLTQRQELKARLADEGFFGFLTEKGDKEQLSNVEFQIYRINNRMLALQKTLEGPALNNPALPKIQAPEIKDTAPTKAEKALDAEIEKIQKANKEWQAGILTVQQYHDAVRQAADLPNSIQGVDALKPIDNSSAIGDQLSALADSLKTREEIETEAYESRKKLVEDNIADEDTSRRIVENLERVHAYNMVEIERDKNSQIMAMRESVLGLSVELLASLGVRSKKFAQAAIVLEKAYAIQKVLIESKVAAMAALTPPPIGLGPVAGQALAAAITASGYAQAGLIGAIGAVQVADVGKSAGGGAGGVDGAFSSPTAAPVSSPQAQRITQVYVQGNVMTEDFVRKNLLPIIRQEVDNSDVILISGNSRNGRELADR